MGKIFDALEKAENQGVKNMPSVKSRKEGTPYGDDDSKVVSFSNIKTSISEQKIDPNLIAYHAPQSVETEMFKVLRTNLLFPSSGKPPKSILVTSSLPGEGKSFVCSNLAVSIAQGVEEHVILIDCDLRKPRVNKIFGYGQTAGLSEYLSDENTGLEKLLTKTPIPKLTLLPAGSPPKNPVELLSSKKMQKFLHEVASRYEDRLILIDSPPTSIAAELNAVTKYIDGVILVVRAGKTSRRAISEAVDQIGKDKIIGTVLNYSDRSTKKYYGYGKTYYKHQK